MSLQTIVHRFLAQDFTAQTWEMHLADFRRAVVPLISTNKPVHDGNIVHLYTDGACSGNPGRGSWAALLCVQQDGYQGEQCEKGDLTIAGRMVANQTTNNRCEMMAAIKGLELVRRAYSVELDTLVIHSDSAVLVNGANGTWKCKKNHDLWQRLHKAQQDIAKSIVFRWVKGHNGDPHNETVDRLARACLQHS